MAEITVNSQDVESIATKLDTMSDQFTEQEVAALHAVFNLAGAAVAEAADAATDVSGHAASVVQRSSFSWGANQGILIGLNQSFQGGTQGSLFAKNDPGDSFSLNFGK